MPAIPVTAQNSEGIVQFEEKVNVHRSLPPDAADMKAMIPEFRTQKNELLFTETESLYRNVEEEEEDEEIGGGGVQIRMQRPEAVYYRNFAALRKINYQEFFGKNYLIMDTLAAGNWKISVDSKQILGYNCLKATTTDTTRKREIVAWFADALPLPSGPAQYGQLPGMILEIDINNGEIVISAKKVEFKKLKKGEIEAPKKGEKISDAEFQKIVAERLRENGGRPMRIIRN
ncbi:MAG: GLPGLI family protein [Lewinellaceae bacterium]|nr:GLPGLI family protein [Lewinellaceae bacterium]